jgi:hypothetical protein
MYCDARERLRGLGFIRTESAIAGQFGEWLAARCLRIQLAQSNVRKAYDAVDRAGQTFQIKARIVSVSRMSTSFDFRKPLSSFDFLLGVLMSKRFDVLAIIRVPHAAVRSVAATPACPCGVVFARWVTQLMPRSICCGSPH